MELSERVSVGIGRIVWAAVVFGGVWMEWMVCVALG